MSADDPRYGDDGYGRPPSPRVTEVVDRLLTWPRGADPDEPEPPPTPRGRHRSGSGDDGMTT